MERKEKREVIIFGILVVISVVVTGVVGIILQYLDVEVWSEFPSFPRVLAIVGVVTFLVLLFGWAFYRRWKSRK